MASSHGLMAGLIKVPGGMANKTAEAYTKTRTVSRDRDFGLTVKKSSGLTDPSVSSWCYFTSHLFT
jgi:hypothetical protein